MDDDNEKSAATSFGYFELAQKLEEEKKYPEALAAAETARKCCPESSHLLRSIDAAVSRLMRKV